MVAVVYHESRGESDEGKHAVIEVVLSRMDDPRWPASACAVVRQPHQFEFVTNGRWPEMTDVAAIENARRVVRTALTIWSMPKARRANGFANGADHFHSGPKPYWANRMPQVTRIDGHRFYRENER